MRETIDPSTGARAEPPHRDGPGDSGRDQSARSDAARQVRTGAKALVRSSGRVLLIRERRSDGSTFWSLPGGGVEPGESPRESLRRELHEEVGCAASLGSLVGQCRYDHTTRPDTTTVYDVFEATLVDSPRPNPDEGVVDCKWLAPSALPDGTLDPIAELLAP